MYGNHPLSPTVANNGRPEPLRDSQRSEEPGAGYPYPSVLPLGMLPARAHPLGRLAVGRPLGRRPAGATGPLVDALVPVLRWTIQVKEHQLHDPRVALNSEAIQIQHL